MKNKKTRNSLSIFLILIIIAIGVLLGYKYVNEQRDELKEAFYTALGRERNGMYKSVNSIKYYSVVMAGFTSESSYTAFNRHAYYITNKLNEDANIRATYFASPNGTDLINYITQQKTR